MATTIDDDKLPEDGPAGRQATTDEVLRLTADQAVQSMDAACSQIEARLERAKYELARLQRSAAAGARAARRAADDTVHQRPWPAIGVAFGVGLLIGALSVLSSRR
jgi:ElaB/YqjD/DUF883 family membrane-anchored ribosome-binding protein